MGREKDTEKLKVVDLENSPLPACEFALINETYFSVPFNTIRLVDRTESYIPGLRTQQDAVRDKYISQANVFPLKLKFVDSTHPDTCFVLRGRTTIGQLSALAHSKLDLNPLDGVEILLDNKMLPRGKLLLSVYEEAIGPDGPLELTGRVVVGAEDD